MAEAEKSEKKFEATPRKLQQARRKGDVPRSKEFPPALVFFVAVVSFLFFVPFFMEGFVNIMTYTLSNIYQDFDIVSIVNDYTARTFIMLLPFFLFIIPVSYLSQNSLGGFVISFERMNLKFSKLNVVSNFKSKYLSKETFVNLVKNLLKLIPLIFITYNVFSSHFEVFFNMMTMDIWGMIIVWGKIVFELLLKIAIYMLFLGIAEFYYQKHEYKEKMKMTRKEFQDDMKDSEGNPQIKGKRRKIAFQMAMKRMMADVRSADVVVTNPTRLAIALKYDKEQMSAPRVVAKGKEELAARIKKIARENNIPIYEDKPLAQLLYKMCEVGDFIPASLYKMVAKVLAFVYTRYYKNRKVR